MTNEREMREQLFFSLETNESRYAAGRMRRKRKGDC
jgi:hypothetical protein